MNPNIKRDSQKFPNQFANTFKEQKETTVQVPVLNEEILKDSETISHLTDDIPPLSTTSCFVSETKNTSPYLLRSSMYTIPADPHLYETINVPLFIVLQPFSHKQEIIGGGVPIFCEECLCYCNTFTKINSVEKYFICHLCGYKNNCFEVDSAQYPTAEYTIEPDKEEVDRSMISNSYFSQRVLPHPVMIFAVQNNSNLKERMSEIRKLLKEEIFAELYAKIAIITFDNEITLYRYDKCVEEHIVCETVPFLEQGFFVSCESALYIIDHLLSREQGHVNDNIYINNVISSVIQLSSLAIGTKAVIFIDTKADLENKDSAVESLNNHNCSINLLRSAKTNLDDVSYLTSGSIYKTKKDLRRLLARSYYGVNVSLKTSDQIAKSNIYTNSVFDNILEIKLATMDSNSTVGYSLYVDSGMKENQDVYVQAVVKYYNYIGERKMIVMNQCFTASYKINSIYKGFCFDTIFSYYCKYISSDIAKIKERMLEVRKMIVKTLHFYRNATSKGVSSTQMILPETVKLLPLLYSCIQKNNYYCNNIEPSIHRTIQALNVERTLRFFYPRVFSLSEYFLEGKINLISNTYANISFEEIYIIENGLELVIYVGQDIENAEMLFEGEEGKVLNGLIETIVSEYDYILDVRVVKQNKCDAEVRNMLVEDKLNNVSAYNDFLCEMHFMIKDC